MKTLLVIDGHNYVPDWIIAHIGITGYTIMVIIVFLLCIYITFVYPIIAFVREKRKLKQSGLPG